MIALLNPMGKTQFQLAYDGPALRAGSMDVNVVGTRITCNG